MATGPLSIVRMVSVFVLLPALAFLAFYMYGFPRASSGPLPRGVDKKLLYYSWTVILLGAPVLVLAMPVLWSKFHWRFERPGKRLAAGLCPTCTYPISLGQDRCPECGVQPSPPAGSMIGFAVRFYTGVVLMLLIGTFLGATTAEVMLVRDEQAYFAEVNALGPSHTRLRRGPFYGELSYSPSSGFWVVDD